MVRARTTGRGARRGAAASGSQRASAGEVIGDGDGNESTTTAHTTATPATLREAVASAPTAVSHGREGTTAATAVTRATTAGRLRPKVVRRDEAGRDKLARQEEKKAMDRAAAERRARGRSRTRSRRSRGDAMGARGGRGISTASGPFSSGLAASAGRGGGGVWFGGVGGGGGSSSSSAAGGSGGRTARSGSKGKTFGEADVRMREARINADKLHIMSPEDELDSEDEAMMAALSSHTVNTMPMGIYRREHKEQGVIVATTAELEAAENATAEEESLWVDGDGSGVPLDIPEEGVWGTAAKAPSIKREPDIEDKMDLDEAIKPALTEEERKKDSPMPSAKQEAPKDVEEQMIQADLDLLAAELGTVTVTDDAGNVTTKEPMNKDGRLYLFQFPPIIPPIKEVARPQSVIKREEEAEGNHVSIPPAVPGARVDLTQDEALGNAADMQEEDYDEDEDEELERQGFRAQRLPRGGLIGKINVRKSGKTELDWGGFTLTLSPATRRNFLTTAVIIEENDEKPQHGVTGGEAVGMGKIMGRFVLGPVWSEEEEWNVAPEDLIAE